MKIENQKKVKETTSKLATHEARVAEIQTKIDEAKVELAALGGSKTPDLKRRHEDMMANAALGVKDPAQAEKLKGEIEVEAARDLRRENLEGIVSGLQRKFDEAELDRRQEAGRLREAVDEVLTAEAQETASEYMEAALKVCAAFRKLMALTAIHADFHGGQNQFGLGQSAARFLSIPGFLHLAAFEGHVGPGRLTNIIEAQDIHDNAGNILQSDVEAERARLLDAGVDLAKAR